MPRFALCPVIEGTLIRHHLRLGGSVATTTAVLAAVHTHSGFGFRSDEPSYLAIDLTWVRGHRQVTDAHLVGLAASKGGVLATLEEALADAVGENTVLLPS